MTEDGTLGGYEQTHARPPAFAGADGRPYTVAAFVDDAPDSDGRYGAALIFVRWSDGGNGPSVTWRPTTSLSDQPPTRPARRSWR